MEEIEQGTPQQEGEQAVEKQKEVPNVEELQAKITEFETEVNRKEEVIKQLKGSLKEAQKRGVPKEELDSIRKDLTDEIRETQDWIATALDDIKGLISGEAGEAKPVKPSYLQQVKEKREAKPKKEPEPEKIDPDVQRFIGYIHSQGLAVSDPLVKEAIGDEDNPRTPDEALKYLKGKIEGKTQAETDKRIQEGIRKGLEQELKERGLTASGATAPNSPSSTEETRLRERYPKMYPK